MAIDIEPNEETSPRDWASNVALVIPTLDAGSWIDRVLRSHRQAFPQAQIVVVDDGSDEATARLLRDKLARPLDLTLARQFRRQGQWRSTLRGCQLSTAPLVLTLDDDVLIGPDAVGEAVAAIDAGADVVYLHPPRTFEPRWRSAGSTAFRRLARMRGFPVEYERATSTRLVTRASLPSDLAVPLDVHLARNGRRVAVIDDAVKKIPDSRSRYSFARLIAHGSAHLLPTTRRTN